MSDPAVDDAYERSAADFGKAVYRCLQCGHRWISNPVPKDCPECGNPYVKWLNYNDRKW